MKYTEIQKFLEKLKVFSVEDLNIIDNNYNKSKIFKWKKSWYLKQIIRWFYLYSNTQINQSLLYFISNKIYSPSYISLESAFNYYWIIPEYVFSITGVSTKKWIDFDSEIAHFSYKKIKSDLFWWYKIININNNKYLIAEIEKAILDYLYLHPKINSIEDFEWLRFNKDILNEKLDFEKLEKYKKMFTSKALNDRVEILINLKYS